MEWEEEVLMEFSKNADDFWTVDDAMKGTAIFGGTGSGKTSGSGKAIAKKMLLKGWGGLVLCAKNDEAKLWQSYAEMTGRAKDLIIFGKNSVHPKDDKIEYRRGKPMVFNPLHYEINRSGEGAGDLFNLTNIFMNLHKIANRASGDGESKKDDRFWDNALRRIIARTIELLRAAGEEITFKNIVDLIQSAPTVSRPFDTNTLNSFIQQVKFEEQNRENLRRNTFLRCLAKSFWKVMDLESDSPEAYQHEMLKRYFSESLPNMSEHTHSAIIESFMGVAEPFLSGILSQHFAGETTLYPEEIYTDSKIIVLNFPIKEYLDAGVMAQSVFKLLFQQAMERRNTDIHHKPVFLWADEAQYFVNPYDQLFLTTARSSRTATVYLSQNISNFYAVMGGGPEAKYRVDSLMGNLATKIFHANSDSETNEYASRLIGKGILYLNGKNSSSELYSLNVNTSHSTSATLQPQILANYFTVLKSGGRTKDYVVEALVFVTGKKWSNKKNYFETFFRQNFQVDENRK